MKKLILLLCFLSYNAQSQYIQSRVLKVKPENMAKFMSAVETKTKMYNSKEGQAQFLTFQILTGPDAQSFVRMQIANNIGEFDTAVNKEELDFWWKTTGKLHDAMGARIWSRNVDASFIPNDAKQVNHRRVLLYKIIPGKEKDFWNYRTRIIKAFEDSGYTQRVGTLQCQSGCDGNWVMVRYWHENFEGELKDNEELYPKVVASYNKLFGEGSMEYDTQKLRESVSENRVRHLKLLPNLSSPRN